MQDLGRSGDGRVTRYLPRADRILLVLLGLSLGVDHITDAISLHTGEADPRNDVTVAVVRRTA